MKILLDTHVFIWWITDDRQLPERIRKIISSSDNELFFSSASCWEIAIKAKLGKIVLPQKPSLYISKQLALNSIKSLPILASHALRVFDLPDIHKDPFDRILVAQATVEGLPIMTSDPLITKYPVEVIWKNRSMA